MMNWSLSSSLDDMTLEYKKSTHEEIFSTDLVHEIRNPLASLKSASEICMILMILIEIKLIDILSHDVQKIN